MREVPVSKVRDTIRDLFIRANIHLGEDVRKCLEKAREEETSPMGQAVLDDLLENVAIASEERVPICQDCGLAVIFLDVGQEVSFTGGDLAEALDEGVRQAYEQGYLRKSVVADPLFERKNSGDNTPAVVHTRIVSGDRICLRVTPKGMGSENMSAIRMMKAADGPEGVMDFVVETVEKAGPNPCPPVVVGVGIGGNFETAPLLAKKALLRPMGSRNIDSRYAGMEEQLLRRINALGIGPAGYGGLTTALDVHIEFAPTHIAGMPVAVNICCHADRHAEAVI